MNSATVKRPMMDPRALPVSLILFFLLLPPALLSQAQGGIISLDGAAAFHPGDDPVWRSPYIDEAGEWSFVRIPGSWERQGFPDLDGYGWYRIRFRVPARLRSDSLLLVMSAVDDVDETYLNGVLVGATGSAPPRLRAEPHSLRVYPLPRALLEERNVLAIRVYDSKDSGGLTGSILRIVPVDSVTSVLNTLIDAPFVAPHHPISNGVLLSFVHPTRPIVSETLPHLFESLQADQHSDPLLSMAACVILKGGRLISPSEWRPDSILREHGTGILTFVYPDSIRLSIHHPHGPSLRALVFTLSHPLSSDIASLQPLYTFLRSSWHLRDTSWQEGGRIVRSLVYTWHGCCPEFAAREMDRAFVRDSASGYPLFSLHVERDWWRRELSSLHFPATLSLNEKAAMEQALVLLLSAIVREPGGGEGLMMSGLFPSTSRRAQPRDMLLGCMALARVGLVEPANSILQAIVRAERDRYLLYDVLGTERGLGYPYLVSPSWYLGNGSEKTWQRKDEAQLSRDGTPLFLEAMADLCQALAGTDPEARRDSLFVRSVWKDVGPRVADLLLFSTEDDSLLRDAGPWLPAPPNAVASVHAWQALRLASRFAGMTGDASRAMLYRDRAAALRQRLLSLVTTAARADSESLLSADATLLFHPLIADAVTLGLVTPGSQEARFLLDLVETAFGIPDTPDQYCAQPDGDWEGRQHRPQIALRLARAHLVNGNPVFAERIAEEMTRLVTGTLGILPELIEPVSRRWYGAQPAIGAGAAEYLLLMLDLADARSRTRP